MNTTSSSRAGWMKPQRASITTKIKRELPYHGLIWIGVIFAFIFSYIPMSGLIIAFKDYSLSKGIWGSEWIGLHNFKNLMNDFYIGNAIINTVCLALIDIALSIPATVVFSLMINEAGNKAFKRTVQTISYLPHFVSFAIMTVLMNNFLDVNDGILNQVIVALGGKAQMFHQSAGQYWMTVIVAMLWKELGWSAIVYLAVMTGIDETLYEAAKIDGAGRLQRIWYITLPALSGIIAIMFILSMGSITGTGFEQAYFLNNALNFKRSNVLSYYVYTIGLRKGDFSYSTAIGLITSIVSAFLIFVSNWTAKKINGTGLF